MPTKVVDYGFAEIQRKLERDEDDRKEKSRVKILHCQLLFNFILGTILVMMLVIIIRIHLRGMHMFHNQHNHGSPMEMDPSTDPSTNEEYNTMNMGHGRGMHHQHNMMGPGQSNPQQGGYNNQNQNLIKTAKPAFIYKGSVLHINDRLYAGESLVSDNGCFVATLQTDGNLVVQKKSDLSEIWSSFTGRDCVNCYGTLTDSGTFVLYDGINQYWSTTGTMRGNFKAQVKMEDSGSLALEITALGYSFDAFITSTISRQC